MTFIMKYFVPSLHRSCKIDRILLFVQSTQEDTFGRFELDHLAWSRSLCRAVLASCNSDKSLQSAHIVVRLLREIGCQARIVAGL